MNINTSNLPLIRRVSSNWDICFDIKFSDLLFLDRISSTLYSRQFHPPIDFLADF